ncbi:MAG: hypothetical protein OES26_02640 [Gammaproteobacteria bacterium]|nr:hypothetical protein [Gammaproteobacteria bacterium]
MRSPPKRRTAAIGICSRDWVYGGTADYYVVVSAHEMSSRCLFEPGIVGVSLADVDNFVETPCK